MTPVQAEETCTRSRPAGSQHAKPLSLSSLWISNPAYPEEIRNHPGTPTDSYSDHESYAATSHHHTTFSSLISFVNYNRSKHPSPVSYVNYGQTTPSSLIAIVYIRYIIGRWGNRLRSLPFLSPYTDSCIQTSRLTRCLLTPRLGWRC
jgi:hypothetical protein